jgi:hypothetical protein
VVSFIGGENPEKTTDLAQVTEFSIVKDRFKVKKGAVMVVFALWLDLQLPVESVPIT